MNDLAEYNIYQIQMLNEIVTAVATLKVNHPEYDFLYRSLSDRQKIFLIDTIEAILSRRVEIEQ